VPGAGRKRGFHAPLPRAADGRAMVGGRILRLVVAHDVERHIVAGNRCISRSPRPGRRTTRRAADLIRRALVLLADHELNGSAFTVRCAASTGLNLYDAMIAGLVALKGPRHGGAAGVLAAQLVKMLVDRDGRPRSIRERVALGRTFSAGFGPRRLQARRFRAAAWPLLAAAGADRRGGETHHRDFRRRILEATGEFVNIDYAPRGARAYAGACRPATNWCCLRWARTRRMDRACEASNCGMAD